MKFLKHLRLKSRSKNHKGSSFEVHSNGFNNRFVSPPPPLSKDYGQELPPAVLRRIFSHVCPHTLDDSLQSSEESLTEGCGLCDMRDLARCAQACRKWYPIVQQVL